MNIYLFAAIWYISQMILQLWILAITNDMDSDSLWSIVQEGIAGACIALVGVIYNEECSLLFSLVSILINTVVVSHCGYTTYTWLKIYVSRLPGRKLGFLTRISYVQVLALIELTGWSITLILVLSHALFYNLNCLISSIL